MALDGGTDGIEGSRGKGTGEKLARVSYLPGARPATSIQSEVLEPETVEPEAVEPEAVEPQPDSTGRGETRAENVSMHALTRRGMSRWELEKTLLSRELDVDIVAAELDRLEAVGLIDDSALAQTFVRTQHDRKGLGRGAIIAELRRRHVDQQHIDDALSQIDDDDEQARATELAVKRAGQLESYDLATAKRRLNGFMMRKGYSSTVVRTAIDEALSPRSSSGRSSSGSSSGRSSSGDSSSGRSSSRSSGVRFR